MTLDESIVNAIRFVDTVYKDVGEVLEASDSFMSEADYVSLWSQCYYTNSKAVYEPSFWAPKTFTRNYVQLDVKKNYNPLGAFSLAFFNVYLTPANSQGPLAMWGWAMKKPGVDFWPVWLKHVIGPSGPMFMAQSSQTKELAPLVQSPQVPAALAQVFETFCYATIKLTDLHGEGPLREMVVSPLLASLGAASDGTAE